MEVRVAGGLPETWQLQIYIAQGATSDEAMRLFQAGVSSMDFMAYKANGATALQAIQLHRLNVSPLDFLGYRSQGMSVRQIIELAATGIVSSALEPQAPTRPSNWSKMTVAQIGPRGLQLVPPRA